MATEDLSLVQDAGDVITDKMLLKSNEEEVDIRALVLQTVIYEDIFSNVLSGTVLIRDAINLINRYTLRGLETLTIKFSTPGFSSNAAIEKTFYITSIKERILDERQQGYVLGLTSVEAIKDNATRISKKFTGKTDNVITNVFNEYLKDEKSLSIIGNHSSNATLVSPYWSPLKIINWFTSRSYTDAFNSVPNFLFYESNKKFYLASLNDLSRLSNYANYIYSPIPNTSDIDLSEKYNYVSGITPVPHFDTFKAQDFGYYSSKLITHDIALKQYKEFQHDHYEYKRNIYSLDRNIPFPENMSKNFDVYRAVKTKQFNMFSETPDPFYESWVPQRNSLLYEANNIRFTIRVPGKTDIEVGRTIHLQIPKSIAKDIDASLGGLENMFDEYLTGRYLITSIRHQFTANKHEMLLEIMKDSFKKSVK